MRTRRAPSKRDEHTKEAIAVATARFERRAKGRIGKKEIRELGRLYGEDLHWKYLRTSGDKLALRQPTTEDAPSSFIALWNEGFGRTFKVERRQPRRWPTSSYAGPETARHFGYYFGWLGPSSGLWPGDSLVFVETRENWAGHAGAWVVRCAPDCPCSRHCAVCRTPADAGHDSLCEACWKKRERARAEMRGPLSGITWEAGA